MTLVPEARKNGTVVPGAREDNTVPQEVQQGPGERATPRRGPGPAPGSNVGPARFMGGMSTEKALDFGGSSRRLLRMLSPQRPLII
ncbi:MAG TPA: hypothetical protein VF506_03660, partial [Streptosporangiaceae bacterium]